jgi:hypothetical protein
MLDVTIDCGNNLYIYIYICNNTMLKEFQMFTNCLCHLMFTNSNRQGVCHNVALPFYIEKYCKAKERIMETQIFHHAKILSSKHPLNKTKILQDIITL